MQGFKGLVPRQILTDQAFLPVYKKAEEHRKAAQLCIDFFQQINKFFQNYSGAIQKSVQECDVQNVKAFYYSLIGHVCMKLLTQNKQLTQNTKGSSKQLTKVCNAILQDFSKYLQNFQGNIRKYQEHQIIIQQLCKKYLRSHKNMLGSIQAYKASLTDVTLIYNMQQKNRRYQACQTNYKIVSADYSAISQKSEILNERKSKIVANYQDFKSQFTKVIKLIGSKVIGQTKNFVSYYCATNKTISTFLAQQKYNLQKQRLETFFWTIENSSNIDIFNLDQIVDARAKRNIPLIFEYPQFIKQQFLQTYNSQIIIYLKKVEENIEKRKQQNKKIYQLFTQYFKIVQKVHIIGVKQVIQNFDKLKKKLVQSFGPRLASFMKSINSIFELLSGINQKLVKTANTQLSNLQAMFNQQSKFLKLFNDELKTNIQKFVGKKQLKKLKQDQFTQQSSVVNIKMYRKEVEQKAQFFKILITGFQQKMSKNCQKISTSYTNIIQNLTQTINEFYSLSCQYQQLYFGPEQFTKNFQIYQSDVDALIEKNKGFFQELVINVLKGDQTKISFDGEFSKIQEFKKLKKPTPNQNLTNSAQKQKQVELKQSKETKQVQDQPKSPKQSNNTDTNNTLTKIQATKSVSMQLQGAIRKNSSKDSINLGDQKQTKNCQFLKTKVQFKQNQQYIKSFSCAMSEKIVLQGRIYITTQRICFSSGFNSSNLFFGKTFIQFPKQDIIKVQKKQNSILMDNSISFTTNKGQLYFTSFFSRNQAYDLICRTFQLSLDEHVYEFKQEIQEQKPQIMIQVKQDDDIKQNQLQLRSNQINSILTSFPYNQAGRTQIIKEGLTAFQILKIFYTNTQITIGRRKYPNFLLYTKQLISHKQVQIDEWNPILSQIMNTSNLKSNAPLKTNRKIRATVPVANAGVPFMPKTAKSQQIQTLYLFSKHKWIIETQINTSGAPYTDTFKVQLRTTSISDQSGKCQISTGLYINFVKNTMMKSVIQSKSQQQTGKATKVWLDQIKKYFVALAKSQSQPKKAQNSAQQIKQLKTELELRTNQLDNIVKQKENLLNQLKAKKQQNQKYKKIIFGLSGLVILFLILLLS